MPPLIFLLIASSAPILHTHAFVLPPGSSVRHGNSLHRTETTPAAHGNHNAGRRNTVLLDAKAGGKKKNKKAAAGGGFGGKTAVATKEATTTKKPPPFAKSSSSSSGKKITQDDNDDYAAFAPLEPGAQASLVPSRYAHGDAAEDMSMEMYDRLAQIYGFHNFNYLTEEKAKEDDAPLSFEDLFSTSSSSSSSSPTPHAPLPLSDLPAFDRFRVLHVDPMVLGIDDFCTDDECDRMVALAENPAVHNSVESRSKTVGKDGNAQAQRTSTTWYHHYKTVPELMAKSCRLLGLDDLTRWEEPQTVRYRGTEKFTWHLDALPPSDDLQEKGGQRTATLLVYLNDLEQGEDGRSPGGMTMFRDLSFSDGTVLKVEPKKGSALLFFPSAGGVPNTPFDVRTLHAGEAVVASSPTDKWIGQLWLRDTAYTPTVPPQNAHAAADDAVTTYCRHRSGAAQ